MARAIVIAHDLEMAGARPGYGAGQPPMNGTFRRPTDAAFT